MATKKDLGTLATIVSAMTVAATPFHMAALKELGKLADENLVETNDEIKEGDKIAVRATEAGLQTFNSEFAPKVATMDADSGVVTIADPEANNSNTADTASNGSGNEGNTATMNTPATGFITGTGFAPSVVRGGKGRNLYDFDNLAVGGFIFVPKTAEKPEPAKSLASTVSSATARFAKPTGETKTVKKTIYKTGEDGKRLKGDDGKLIVDRVEDATVPVMEETRKFAVQSVEGGKAYGDFTAPSDGAVIYRSA